MIGFVKTKINAN